MSMNARQRLMDFAKNARGSVIDMFRPRVGASPENDGVRIFESPLFEDYRSLASGPQQEVVPVNLQTRSSEQIRQAADYSARTGKVALDMTNQNRIPLAEKTVLEIGPGWDFGSAMIMGENAKKLIVADKYLASWDNDFHPQVYRAIQTILGKPSKLLDAVVASGGYNGHIETLEEPAYALGSISSNSVDYIYSNAVLEHVHPLDKAAVELFRVTAPGGYGAHQVDFRYHRNFDYPLEYLLLTRAEFSKLLELTHCEVGCQTRVKEAAEYFAAAGFEIITVEVNCTASPDYMQTFLPRLRASPLSPYRDWPADELAKLGARLIVRKPL